MQTEDKTLQAGAALAMAALWAPSTCGQRLTEPTKPAAALPAAPALPCPSLSSPGCPALPPSLQPRLPCPALPSQQLPNPTGPDSIQLFQRSWGRDVTISSKLLSTFHQSTSPQVPTLITHHFLEILPSGAAGPDPSASLLPRPPTAVDPAKAPSFPGPTSR